MAVIAVVFGQCFNYAASEGSYKRNKPNPSIFIVSISGVASWPKPSLNDWLMEGKGGSWAADRLINESRRSRLILAPKEFFISPFFAAQPQTGERKVTVGNRHYHIGGFNPLDANSHPPALDVRHARVIFSLLSFRQDSLDKAQLIRFSFNQLCQRYANSNGGRYSRAIKKILADLTSSFIRITNVETGVAHTYRLIERVDIEERPIRRKDAKLAKSAQLEMWFNSCTLSPEFAGLLSDIEELQHLKFDVFNSIRSPLAQAIYLYIPSRAHYYTETKPFEITLTKLLEQVSCPVPQYKSKREELFIKHSEEGRAIIQQLEGLETISGIFHVRLAQTSDGSDFKLQAWVEKNRRPKLMAGNSKLISAWLASGRTLALLEQRLANAGPLDEYELDLLDKAAVQVKGNERFFVMAKAMLPRTQFIGLLHEAKCDEQEGHAAKKNPTARLIWRIKSAIQELGAAQSPHNRGLDNGGNA